MVRRQSNQTEVLEAIRVRLSCFLSLPDEAVYHTYSPNEFPVIPRPGHYALSVSFGQGGFNEQLQFGGGQGQLVEDLIISVTGYTIIQTDRADRSKMLMTDPNRGLISVIKKNILGALTDYDPQDSIGDHILVSHVTILSSSGLSYDKDTGQSMIRVNCRVPFSWDLSNVQITTTTSTTSTTSTSTTTKAP
jgi:hypothetical protein